MIQFHSQGLSYQLHPFTPPYRELMLYAIDIQGSPKFEFERILPAPGLQLVINLSQRIKAKFKARPGIVEYGAYSLQGNQFAFFDSYLPAQTHFFIAAFSMKGMMTLLQLPSGELVDDFTHDVGKRPLDELVMRLVEAGSHANRIQLLQRWMEKRAVADFREDISDLVQQKLIAQPTLNQRELERFFGYSAKYLNRRFKHYTGFTISNFKRLARFYRTLREIRAGKDETWMDLVHQHQYYDQSHFIKEIRQFTGLTPSGLKSSLLGHNNPIFQHQEVQTTAN